ncbi:redox protein [Gemmobacter lanyuensis]|uniref:Redox protein n=1 Tax=Gemmobacter lanyuensis TaxID=1054497 RepID=A0A918J0N0_9RHOB|nr:OsmC family protein [Gemmobacter lanyuensis]GGW39611.1 redox protein [Gemmobacter lanyuensis]
MSEHEIRVTWRRAEHATTSGTYSRDHLADYGSDTRIAVSAAPDYLGNPALADPEQLLANALASCHLLYFLALCEGSGYRVESYEDRATARVEKLPEGGFGVTTITLRPRAVFGGDKQPTAQALHRLHDRAHTGCFIANSIKSDVLIVLEGD